MKLLIKEFQNDESTKIQDKINENNTMASMPPLQLNSFVGNIQPEANEDKVEIAQDLSTGKRSKNSRRSTELIFRKPINMRIKIPEENHLETIVSPLDLREEEPQSPDQNDNSKIVEEFMNKNSMNT